MANLGDNESMALYKSTMFHLADICKMSGNRVETKGDQQKTGVAMDYWDDVIQIQPYTAPKDKYWMTPNFFPAKSQIGFTQMSSANAYRSTTQWKFTNTALGGHIAINPRPQFTRYADIRNVNRANINSAESNMTIANMGMPNGGAPATGSMGRYYSEAIDDNAELIYMQFGTPKFNNIISFFTRAITYEDAYVANHGRLPIGYGVGKFVGGIIVFAAFPLITSLIWISKFAYAFFSGDNQFDYYYMEPAMVNYWGSVNTIVTQMAVELGILHADIMEQDNAKFGQKMGTPVAITQDSINAYKELYPGIIADGTNYIDVFAIVTRAQKLANARRIKERLMYQLEEFNEDNALGFSRNPTSSIYESFIDELDTAFTFSNMAEYIGNIMKSPDGEPGEVDFKKTEIRYEDEMVQTETVFSNTQARIAAMGKNQLGMGVQKTPEQLEAERKAAEEAAKQKEEQEKSGETTQAPMANDYYAQKETMQQNANEAAQKAQEAMNSGRLYMQNYRKAKAKQGGGTPGVVPAEQISGLSQKAIKSKIAEVDIAGTYPNDMTKTNGSVNSYYTATTNVDNLNAAINGDGTTIDAWLRGGGHYAVFAVDYSGSVSDSFNNSVSNVQLGDGVKSVAQGARNLKFNFSGGNILGDTVQAVTGAITQFAAGAIDSISFGLSNVITALTGGAYVDVPKKWDDSDVQLGNVSYSIDLISPYGNVLSQLQNIYIPLAMLLAGALPQKGGEASYTSPFLCSIFNKGKQNIKLGMITSLTIERGTSNLAYNKYKKALAYKVSFTVTDFSNLVTTPISASFWGGLTASINESGGFGRYLSVLCSRSLLDDKYMMPAWKRKYSKFMMSVDQKLNGNYWEALASDTILSPFSWFLHDQSIALNESNGNVQLI